MATKPSKANLARDARLIFEGVVKALNSSTAKGNLRKNSIVVHVAAVTRAPDILSDLSGQDVTVWLAEGEKIAAGERAVFYTYPAHWGESIAVQSLGHTAPEGAGGGRRASAAAVAVPPKSAAEEKLEQQVSNADVVVTGKVAAVRLPQEDRPAISMRRSAGVAAPAEPRRISEHDPMWREAVIDVHDVHKGERRSQVVVRFPKSNDVRWRTAPKFQTGQQGVFLLQKQQIPAAQPEISAGRRSAGVAAPSVEAYTALTPTDFQPIDRVEGIKTLIRAAQGRKK